MRKGKMDQEALRYHSEGRQGKSRSYPTKPYHTQHDLSLAYSPASQLRAAKSKLTPKRFTVTRTKAIW